MKILGWIGAVPLMVIGGVLMAPGLILFLVGLLVVVAYEDDPPERPARPMTKEELEDALC